jgi:prepilin-type N-terminal cleavage/methylation domain-containing protein
MFDGMRARRGFTLVELLVVIAIIAILVALGAWGTMAMIGRQQTRNTEATIKTLNKLLQDRWKAVITDARKETPSAAAKALANGPAGNLDSSGQRAQVIMIKARLMEAFPMRYNEATPAGVVNTFLPQHKSYFAKYLTSLGPNTGGGAGESSACLLAALNAVQAEGGVGIEDQIKFAVSSGDGVNPNISVLTDAWGNPLSFFRFPTNNADLQAANPATAGSRSARFADPVDTEGSLLNSTWYNSPAVFSGPTFPAAWQKQTPRQVFESSFHVIARPGVSPMAAFFTVPVIVSAGPDGKLGVNPDLSPVAGSADNIFSFKLLLD